MYQPDVGCFIVSVARGGYSCIYKTYTGITGTGGPGNESVGETECSHSLKTVYEEQGFRCHFEVRVDRVRHGNDGEVGHRAHHAVPNI